MEANSELPVVRQDRQQKMLAIAQAVETEKAAGQQCTLPGCEVLIQEQLEGLKILECGGTTTAAPAHVLSHSPAQVNR